MTRLTRCEFLRYRQFPLRILLILVCGFGLYAAEHDKLDQVPSPDERFKADILVVVAHPDDETAITGYLARAIFDEHKRVAVIFGTRGNGGGNAVGLEQAAALGAVREIEARRALASFGVHNVWFLGAPDTPGQDVLRSLETWNHGTALEQTVRLVRLTQPEVILTWLPAYTAGENHGDHQAAGVIATEAFDSAGDATAFAEQVTPPRDRFYIGNLTEGLHSWQARKIYYFSDASRTDFLEGKGPVYSTHDKSNARGVPYYRLVAEEMSFHLTQSDTGQFAKAALDKGDLHAFQQPVRFIFGKSLVGGTIKGDIFDGIIQQPLSFVRNVGYKTPKRDGISAELGGPWAFYKEFWRTHGLDQLETLVDPEVEIGVSSMLSVPVIVHNATDQLQVISVNAIAPSNWKPIRGSVRSRVGPHQDLPAELLLNTPAEVDNSWQTLQIKVNTDPASPLTLKLKVHVVPAALPQ